MWGTLLTNLLEPPNFLIPHILTIPIFLDCFILNIPILLKLFLLATTLLTIILLTSLFFIPIILTPSLLALAFFATKLLRGNPSKFSSPWPFASSLLLVCTSFFWMEEVVFWSLVSSLNFSLLLVVDELSTTFLPY